MRWRRVALGALGVGAITAGLLGVGAVGGVLWLRTPAGNQWIRLAAVGAVQRTLVEGSFEIERLETDLLTGIALDGVRFRDASGEVLLSVAHARARYALGGLLKRDLRVRALDAVGIDVVLDADDEGRMKLAALWGPPSTTPSDEPFSLPIGLQVDAIRIEGVSVRQGDGLALAGGVATGRLVAGGARFELADLSLCAHLVAPGPSALCAEGPVVWDGYVAQLSGLALELPGAEIALEGAAGGEQIALVAHVGGLDLGALDPLLGGAGLTGRWGGILRVDGPPDALAITGQLAGAERGAIAVDGRLSVGESIAWGGALELADFHVEDLLGFVDDPIRLVGRVSLDGKGFAWPDGLELGVGFDGEVDLLDRIRLDGLGVRGAIAGGVLTLERADFLGIAGQLGATGTIDLVRGPLDVRVRGRVIPAEIAELGIEGLAGSGRADVRIRGDILAAPQDYAVAGRVVMEPFGYTPDVRFDRLVVDLDGATRGVDFRFDLVAAGEGGAAYGIGMRALAAPDLVVASTAGDLHAFGSARVEAIDPMQQGAIDDALVRFDARLAADGSRAVDAEVALGAFDLQTFLGTGGSATVQVVDDAVGFAVALDDGERAFLRTRGTFDLSTRRLEADALSLAPTVRLAWVAPGPVAATLTDGGVADASIALRGEFGDLGLVGTLGTQGPLDGRIEARGLQLDALAELFPDAFDGLSGVLTAEVAVSGDASAVRARGTADVAGLWVDGVTRWLDVAGRFEASDGGADVDLQFGSAGTPLADLRGRLPLVLDLAQPGLDPSGRVNASFALRPGPLERLQLVAVTPLGLPEGRISGSVTAFGRLSDPRIRVAGVVESPLGGWADPARVEIDVRRDEGELDAWASVAEGLTERLRVAGAGQTRLGEVFAWALGDGPEPDFADLKLYLDEMDVAAVLSGLPVESVTRAGELAVDARGQLVGVVTASGDPYTPEVQGDLRWIAGILGGIPLGDTWLTVAPDPAGLAVESAISFAGGRATVAGTVPVAIDLREDSAAWTDGALDLRVASEGVPLSLLAVVDPGVSQATGTLDLNGSIGGTLGDPLARLDLTLPRGALSYAPIGLRLSDLTMRAEVDGRRLIVHSARANTSPMNRIGLVDQGRSAVSIAGAANLEQFYATELSVRVLLDDAWLLGTPDAGARLAGELLLSGAWPELNVRSPRDLTLVQGRVRYDSDQAVAAGALQPAPGLTIARGAESVVFESVVVPPIYAGFKVNVGLDLKRNLEVLAQVPYFDELGSVTATLTQATVGARLGGRVDVSLDPAGDPVLAGEIDVVDGSVQVLRSNFQLDNGRVVFLGGELGETQLDLGASTSVQGTPIELRIAGTMDAPALTTTSPGFDQTQVMMMLLTGRAPGSVAGDEGRALAASAAALLASSVFAGASGALTIDPDGSVRVGAPWSSSVFTQLVVRPFAEVNENRFSGSLDWSVARRLVLELGAGDRYQWSGLSWEVRF